MIHQAPGYSSQPPQKLGFGVILIAILWPLSVLTAFLIGVNAEEPQSSVKAQPARPIDTPRSLPNLAPSAAPVQAPGIEVYETTPNEVAQFYRKNQVFAADWLKGKTIRISARLGGVSNNIFGGDRAAIVFFTQLDDFLSPDVIYWYEASSREQIGKLVKGQMVTVDGSFEEGSWSGDLTFRGTAIYTN